MNVKQENIILYKENIEKCSIVKPLKMNGYFKLFSFRLFSFKR